MSAPPREPVPPTPSEDPASALGVPGWSDFVAARERFAAARARDAVLARLERAWAESPGPADEPGTA
jgi:hypothetical protein